MKAYNNHRETVLENCERNNLLTQCANPPPVVGETAKGLDVVQIGVDGYADVETIDWSKW